MRTIAHILGALGLVAALGTSALADAPWDRDRPAPVYYPEDPGYAPTYVPAEPPAYAPGYTEVSPAPRWEAWRHWRWERARRAWEARREAWRRFRAHEWREHHGWDRY